MPCFKPLTAWRGSVGESGKRSVVFKASDASPGLSVLDQKLPCGQCVGCRLDYSYDWAVRCVCEAQMHKQNSLILLTYEKVPPDGSLQLLDWQNFMKALRKAVGPVRHFHAGEYGTQNGRPHDHALLFGYDFPDKVYFKMAASGHRLYRSKILEKLWNKGNCSVGEMSFDSAGYLARYLLDKPTLTRQVKDDVGNVIGRTFTDKAISKYGVKVDFKTGEEVLLRRPEYLTMSRGGRDGRGIGYSWFQKFRVDVFPRDYMVLDGGRKMPPPRYFDSLYEAENPLDMKRIKLARLSRCTKKEDVWNQFLEKFQLLDVARDDRLRVREVVKEAQLALYNSRDRGAFI